MSGEKKQSFCGPPGISLNQILGYKSDTNVTSWFVGNNFFYVHKARTAIRHACQLMRLDVNKEILVPSYNCGSEVDPIMKSGASSVLYRVDKRARADIDDVLNRITNNTKAIYITHYFGFPQNVSEIKKICEQRDLYLIEDCALSLFSCSGARKLGTVGDVSVFNFPKTLPVPDGGVLAINNPSLMKKYWERRKPSDLAVLESMLPLLKSSILRWSANKNLLYLFLCKILKKKHRTLFKNSKQNTWPDIPRNYYYDDRMNNLEVSAITRRFLKSFDFNHIKKQRRENFKHYKNLLSGRPGIKPLFAELTEGVCPLYFPIVIRNRNEICAKLNKESIAAIAWWSGYHKGVHWKEYPDACFLKNNLLALPVHQNLNKKQITYIIKTLLKMVQ